MTSASKSRMREGAIQALMSTATNAEAATKCGVSERTLQRWLAEPKFSSEYSAAKNRLLESTINGLRSIGLDGVAALQRIAADKDSPAGATVAAGRAILEMLLKAVEVQDFATRLTDLEKSIAEDK